MLLPAEAADPGAGLILEAGGADGVKLTHGGALPPKLPQLLSSLMRLLPLLLPYRAAADRADFALVPAALLLFAMVLQQGLLPVLAGALLGGFLAEGTRLDEAAATSAAADLLVLKAALSAAARLVRTRPLPAAGMGGLGAQDWAGVLPGLLHARGPVLNAAGRPPVLLLALLLLLPMVPGVLPQRVAGVQPRLPMNSTSASGPALLMAGCLAAPPTDLMVLLLRLLLLLWMALLLSAVATAAMMVDAGA